MYPSPHIVDKENKIIWIHFRLRNKSWKGSFLWKRCSFLLMLFTVLKEETIWRQKVSGHSYDAFSESRNIYVKHPQKRKTCFLNLKQRVRVVGKRIELWKKSSEISDWHPSPYKFWKFKGEKFILKVKNLRIKVFPWMSHYLTVESKKRSSC